MRRTRASMTVQKATKKKGVSESASPPYTSRIIKAGALLDDTKTLLSHWDVTASVPENLDRIRRENVFGKASRSRVEDILGIFRQRYLTESEVTEALVPKQAQGITEIDLGELQRAVGKWVESGLTTRAWSENTTVRVAQGLLATLRDFGVLQGAINKRIAPAYLPVTAFAYIAFYLKQHQPSGAKLLEHPDWKLFFLNREGVERFFFEANQHGLLEYHAAGTVTRLTFPASTLEEYANVLAERSH